MNDLTSQPEDPSALLDLAAALEQRGQLPEALAVYDRLLARDDRNPHLWHRRGLLLKSLGLRAEAAIAFGRLVELVPDLAIPHFNLGVILGQEGRWVEALRCFDRAIACDNGYAKAHANRAAALGALGRYTEALASSTTAVALMPGLPDAHRNRGTALHSMGRIPDAIAAFEAALALAPDFSEARYNLGLAQLTIGALASGWRNCESRWQRQDKEPARHTHIPRWRGDRTLAGRRILLWSEQGYGDTLQFCRYALEVAELGGDVILEVQSALQGLLCGLSSAIPVYALGEALPPCDLQIPMMSLPDALGTAMDTIPCRPAYLRPPPARVAVWRERLARIPGTPRIGLAFSGNPDHALDRHRSIPFAAIEPHIRGLPVCIVQKEIPERDAMAVQAAGLTCLGETLTDFAETAAAIGNLDLVITVDTSLAHLTGALGKPVWILLSANSDWRWLRQGSRSPWYPSARLFRQAELDDWGPVLAAVAAELKNFPSAGVVVNTAGAAGSFPPYG
jgi:tetratricopeptide (TPR) repeat protein